MAAWPNKFAWGCVALTQDCIAHRMILCQRLAAIILEQRPLARHQHMIHATCCAYARQRKLVGHFGDQFIRIALSMLEEPGAACPAWVEQPSAAWPLYTNRNFSMPDIQLQLALQHDGEPHHHSCQLCAGIPGAEVYTLVYGISACTAVFA